MSAEIQNRSLAIIQPLSSMEIIVGRACEHWRYFHLHYMYRHLSEQVRNDLQIAYEQDLRNALNVDFDEHEIEWIVNWVTSDIKQKIEAIREKLFYIPGQQTLRTPADYTNHIPLSWNVPIEEIDEWADNFSEITALKIRSVANKVILDVVIPDVFWEYSVAIQFTETELDEALQIFDHNTIFRKYFSTLQAVGHKSSERINQASMDLQSKIMGYMLTSGQLKNVKDASTLHLESTLCLELFDSTLQQIDHLPELEPGAIEEVKRFMNLVNQEI